MIKAINTTLSICHHLYLTKEQRYSFHEGNNLEIIGISMPVWCHKNKTSEPASELFCEYKLINECKRIFIKPQNNGYEIIIPPPNNRLGEKMPNTLDLLDLRDGGIEQLSFRQTNKINKKGKVRNILHYVEIKDIEYLLQTLS